MSHIELFVLKITQKQTHIKILGRILAFSLPQLMFPLSVT